MEVIHPRRAGNDVSKKDAKVCVRGPGPARHLDDGDYVGVDHRRDSGAG
jgi:hypothetical protein